MSKVTFDYSKATSFISEDEVTSMKKIAEDAKKVLVEKTGAGNDFLGWIDLPVDYDKDEFDRIKKAAKKIQGDSEDMVSTTMYQRKLERHLKSTTQETALARHTYRD